MIPTKISEVDNVYDLAAYAIYEAKGREPESLHPDKLIKEAMSTSDFPTLVSNVQNKVLLGEYRRRPHIWRQVALTRPTKDFKTITALRMGEYGDLVEVEGTDYGQAFDRTVDSTEVVTYAPTLYAIEVEHLWKLLIEDDIAAFNMKIQRLARACARSKEKAVANLFNQGQVLTYDPDSVVIFHAGSHSNDQSTDLTAANLRTAVNLLAGQTDAQGNPIAFETFALMVSTTWWQSGVELFAQSGGIQALASRLARESQPVVFDQLGMVAVLHNPHLTADTWYLVADPVDVSCIEVAELQGLEEPLMLESAGFWKQKVRGYDLTRNMTTINAALMGWGAKWTNYRGVVKGK